MIMFKGEKKLSDYIIGKYIAFSITIIIVFSIFYSLMDVYTSSVSSKEIFSHLNAENIVRPDYKNINIGYLKNINGWVEILDSNNNVIYTKGNVLEKKASYTEQELLEETSFKSLMKSNVIEAGMLRISKTNDNKPEYLATLAEFKGTDGKNYTCIEKFPRNKIISKFMLVNPTGELKNIGIRYCMIFLAGTLFIFAVCLHNYSRAVHKHIEEPNKKLVKGLEDITSGDYSTRIVLNAEYEYREIQDSFNYLADELEKAENNREEYEKERQQLFSSIAHDLKTPITTMEGYSKAVLEGLVKEPDKVHEYMTTILNKTKHLNELVDLLLVYTRLNNKEYVLHFEKTEITEFVREIIAEYFDEFEKNDMKLTLDITDEEIFMNIDRTEMRRVITNLLMNSVKHNPKGTEVKVKLYADNKNNVVFEVDDNGSKIPESIKEHIFEPFVCGDESRTSKNGSGLGLSICKKIVERHSGKIEYKDINEDLKCFKITIPKDSNKI